MGEYLIYSGRICHGYLKCDWTRSSGLFRAAIPSAASGQRGVKAMNSGLRDTTEQTMIAAHRAGMAYWKRNKPYNATRDSLASLARSCGWHGDDNVAWLAGYYGAKKRDTICPD